MMEYSNILASKLDYKNVVEYHSRAIPALKIKINNLERSQSSDSSVLERSLTCLFLLSSLSACALSALSRSASILALTSAAASDFAASTAEPSSPSCRAALSCDDKKG